MEELDWTTFFVLPNAKPRGALWIWITSLSWTGFNNDSRHVLTITPEFVRVDLGMPICIICRLLEGYEAEKVLERVGLLFRTKLSQLCSRFIFGPLDNRIFLFQKLDSSF